MTKAVPPGCCDRRNSAVASADVVYLLATATAMGAVVLLWAYGGGVMRGRRATEDGSKALRRNL